jgi:hypothetical protein
MTGLDRRLWEPTPLGIVCPRGFLTQFADGRINPVIYGALDEGDLAVPADSDDGRRRLRLVEGRRALRAEPILAHAVPRLLAWPAPFSEDAWFAVIAEDCQTGADIGFEVGCPWWFDQRLGLIDHIQVKEAVPDREAVIDLLVRRARHHLVTAGFTAAVSSAGSALNDFLVGRGFQHLLAGANTTDMQPTRLPGRRPLGLVESCRSWRTRSRRCGSNT